MPDLATSVGKKGHNQSHDVALVQAMLRVLKNAKNQPYLTTPYSGLCDLSTQNAITAFQTDKKLATVPVPVWTYPPGKAPPPPQEDVYGQVSPGSATLNRMTADLPVAYRDLTIVPNTKTVYLAGSQADRDASKKQISEDPQLEAVFRQKVVDLVDAMFARHKIVLWLTPTGSRRTFAQQDAEVKTKAGPGESNHNFGRAVDIGFKGFRWIQGDGAIKKDGDWLNALEKLEAAKANAFWDVRDAIALKEVKLYRLAFERVHLQAFDNDAVSSGRSLVALLNRVGAMKWGASYLKPAWRYTCDLGLGGTLHAVGTSKEIWAGKATVTKTLLAQTRSAPGKKVGESDIKDDDVARLRSALKKDFETADKGWAQWAPVP